jgi:hypothetical protein
MAHPGHIQAFQRLLFHIHSDDNDARFVPEPRFLNFSGPIHPPQSPFFPLRSNATEWNIQIFSFILLH